MRWPRPAAGITMEFRYPEKRNKVFVGTQLINFSSFNSSEGTEIAHLHDRLIYVHGRIMEATVKAMMRQKKRDSVRRHPFENGKWDEGPSRSPNNPQRKMIRLFTSLFSSLNFHFYLPFCDATTIQWTGVGSFSISSLLVKHEVMLIYWICMMKYDRTSTLYVYHRSSAAHVTFFFSWLIMVFSFWWEKYSDVVGKRILFSWS